MSSRNRIPGFTYVITGPFGYLGSYIYHRSVGYTVGFLNINTRTADVLRSGRARTSYTKMSKHASICDHQNRWRVKMDIPGDLVYIRQNLGRGEPLYETRDIRNEIRYLHSQGS